AQGTLRRCASCGKVKSLNGFSYLAEGGAARKNRSCMECEAARMRRYATAKRARARAAAGGPEGSNGDGGSHEEMGAACHGPRRVSLAVTLAPRQRDTSWGGRQSLPAGGGGVVDVVTDRQCQEIKRDGTRCRGRALPGDTGCAFHSERTRARREAGRRA